ESGQIEQGAITQIWESELITPSPFTVSTSLPEDLREKIRSIYLEMLNVDALTAAGECDESAENCGLGTWGYVAIDDSAYDGVRMVCESTEADACHISNQ